MQPLCIIICPLQRGPREHCVHIKGHPQASLIHHSNSCGRLDIWPRLQNPLQNVHRYITQSTASLQRKLNSLRQCRPPGRVCVCVCVRFLDYNHALAYNHKFWIFFLPCGNVKAHHIYNVPSPICPIMNRNLTNKIQSEEVQEKNKRRIQPPHNHTHNLKCKNKEKRSEASKRRVEP